MEWFQGSVRESVDGFKKDAASTGQGTGHWADDAEDAVTAWRPQTSTQ